MMLKKLFYLLFLLASPLGTQADTLPPDTVLAESKGVTVTAQELMNEVRFVQRNKALKIRPNPSTLKQLTNKLLTLKLLVAQAEQLGLDQDPLVRYGMERERANILSGIRLEQIGQDLSEKQRELLAREFYLLHKERYTTAGKRQLSHILIGANNRSVEQAKALAEQLAGQLAADPSRFEQLAGQYSGDKGSRGKGGQLGWVRRDALVKPFADVGFGLEKPGQISPPVETRFGYHIIRLDALPTGQPLSYEQVKANIYPRVEDEYRKTRRKQFVDNLSASGNRSVNTDAIERVYRVLD